VKRVVCLLAAAVLSGAVLAGCTGKVPGGASHTAASRPAASGWVEQEVSFQAGGMTVYATYRHPPSGSPPVSAALLIAGSGPTDRDGNDRQYPYMDTLRTVAGWLSDDGVASLRYDKLGTGRTGAGPYAGQPAAIGVDVFEQQAAGALTFLAAQPGVRRDRLTVAGHSEGALYALLLATGAAGPVPPIHALALLEPLSRRLLDTIAQQIDERLTAQQQAGQITPEQAQQIRDAMSSAIAQLRATGTVPANLPGGLSTLLSPVGAKYLGEIDRFDPADLVTQLPVRTPVLLSCSDADIQISCTDVDRLVTAAAKPPLDADPVRLAGVDHILKEDASRGIDYDQPLPFSHALQQALRSFVAAQR